MRLRKVGAIALVGDLDAYRPAAATERVLGRIGDQLGDDEPGIPALQLAEHDLVGREDEVNAAITQPRLPDRAADPVQVVGEIDASGSARHLQGAVRVRVVVQTFRRGRNEEPQNEIAIAGVITGLKVAKSKRSGELYAQAALEDTVGKIELIAFPQSYEKLAAKLKIDVPVVVRGVLRGEEDSAPKLAISSIQALEDVKLKLPESLRIKVPLGTSDAALLEKLHAIFLGAPGKGKLLLDLEEPGEFCAVLEPHNVMVAADRLFIDQVEELVGRGGVRVIG